MMSAKVSEIERQAILLVGSFVFFYILNWAHLIFLPVTVAFFIYSLFIPLLVILKNKFKISKQLSSIILMSGLFLVAVTFFIPLLEGLKGFVKDLAEYGSILRSLKEPAIQKVTELGFDISQQGIIDFLAGLPLTGVLQSTTGILSEFITVGFLVFLFLTFMFLEKDVMASSEFLQETSQLVRTFFWSKMIVSLMSSVLISIFLALMGVSYPLMFGALSFLLSFVPAVGQFISSLLPLPLVYLNHPSWTFFFAILIIPNLIQSFFENFVWPKLLKDSIGLHPITILACLIFWTMIWGVVGTFFAIPLTAIVRLICEKHESLRPISAILKGHFTK